MKSLSEQAKTLRHNIVPFLLAVAVSQIVTAWLVTNSEIPVLLGLAFVFANQHEGNTPSQDSAAIYTGALIAALCSIVSTFI